MSRTDLPARVLNIFPVRAEDGSERHVLGAGRRREPAGELRRREDHGEVLLLLCAHDDEDAGRAERADTVTNRGEIRRGVAEATVLFADDERQRRVVTAGETRREDAQRAFALDDEPFFRGAPR